MRAQQNLFTFSPFKSAARRYPAHPILYLTLPYLITYYVRVWGPNLFGPGSEVQLK